MSSFKELTENTITTNGDALNGHLTYNLGKLTVADGTKFVYFGLKNSHGSISENLNTDSSIQLTSTPNISGCTAWILGKKDYWYTTNNFMNKGREIKLYIPSTSTSRTIQFSYNGMTVFTVKQNVTPNQLLICKPTWRLTDYITNVNYIALSRRNDGIPSNISQVWLSILKGISYTLFAIEKLNHPSTVIWHTEKLETISSHLKYIKGQNFLSNQNYYLLNVKVVDVDNNTIIQDDFDKIKSLGTLFVYLKTSDGIQYYSGQLNMKEDGNYMLAEID